MRYHVSPAGRMLCNRRPLWPIIISLHTPITSMGLQTKTSGPLSTGKGWKLRVEMVSEKRQAPNRTQSLLGGDYWKRRRAGAPHSPGFILFLGSRHCTNLAWDQLSAFVFPTQPSHMQARACTRTHPKPRHGAEMSRRITKQAIWQ